METTTILATIVTMTKKNVSTCATQKREDIGRGLQETSVLPKEGRIDSS
jgi:hypothetical protein